MTTNSKKILITTESTEIYFVRMDGSSRIRAACARCAAEAEWLMLDQAVCLSGTSTRELVHQIESGDVHSLETESGHLVVCRSSLEGLRKGIRTATLLSETEVIDAPRPGDARVLAVRSGINE